MSIGKGIALAAPWLAVIALAFAPNVDEGTVQGMIGVAGVVTVLLALVTIE